MISYSQIPFSREPQASVDFAKWIMRARKGNAGVARSRGARG
jgi:hypothetical protein